MKTTFQFGYPDGPNVVDPRFDQQAVQLVGSLLGDDLRAYRRRELPVTVGGQPVLQDTRTSAWDFAAVPRDPFAKPE